MKAEEIASDLVCKWAEGFDEKTSLETLIAQAIREAQDEAIERTAVVVDTWHYKKGGYSELAHQLRALKTEKGGVDENL